MIARNRDVFSLIHGYRFHVLALSRKSLSRDEIQTLASALWALPRSIGIPLETHIVAHSLLGRDERVIQAESNQVFEAYGLTAETPQALYFIRPDGYVAYRSNSLELAGLKAFIGNLGGGKKDV